MSGRVGGADADPDGDHVEQRGRPLPLRLMPLDLIRQHVERRDGLREPDTPEEESELGRGHFGRGHTRDATGGASLGRHLVLMLSAAAEKKPLHCPDLGLTVGHRRYLLLTPQ